MWEHSKVKLVECSQGSMLQVSPHFLEQTLDKKLMSDLRVSDWSSFKWYLLKCFYFKRTVSPSFPLLLLCFQRKRTAHERAKDLFASGEFSSGRKWADDAPKEKLDSNTVNLIASGACGAFVHGLEDEMFGTWNTVPKWCNFLTSPFFTSLFYDFMLSDLSLLMLFQRSVLRQWRRSASSLGRLRASLKSVWTSWSTCSTTRSRKWGWSPSTCWEKSPHI